MALENWRRRARGLKRDTFALYLAARDPRVPWYTKALALGVVGYALSPIDLIPDFIPIIGYLDDLILVPLGIALVLSVDAGLCTRRIPRARTGGDGSRSYSRVPCPRALLPSSLP